MSLPSLNKVITYLLTSWIQQIILFFNAKVFIAQFVEHCSSNAEAMGSNLLELPKFLSVNLQLLKLL